MRLYGLPFSPYTHRALLVARLKGQVLDLVPPPGGLVSAEFGRLSPTGRIPVLEDADGWRLCESGAIAHYLDEMLPGVRLLPDDPRDRARLRQVEDLCDKELGAGLRHFALQRLFRVYQDESRLAFGREQVALGLAALDRVGVGDATWALGEAPGLGDAALIPVLAFLHIFETDFDAGPLLDPGSGTGRYWRRASADPLGAGVLDAMRAIVPVLKARHARGT